MRRDTEIRGDQPGPSERRHERAMRNSITQGEINAALVRLLRQCAYPPDELFCAPTTRGDRAGIEECKLGEAAIRNALADALERPSEATLATVGRCAMRLMQLAMRETVVDHIERQRP